MFTESAIQRSESGAWGTSIAVISNRPTRHSHPVVLGCIPHTPCFPVHSCSTLLNAVSSVNGQNAAPACSYLGTLGRGGNHFGWDQGSQHQSPVLFFLPPCVHPCPPHSQDGASSAPVSPQAHCTSSQQQRASVDKPLPGHLTPRGHSVKKEKCLPANPLELP